MNALDHLIQRPDESLYDYLERRERVLVHQIAALRGQLEPKEMELAHVQSAKRQLDNLGSVDKARLGVPQRPKTRLGTVGTEPTTLTPDQVAVAASIAQRNARAAIVSDPAPSLPSPYEGMTIKELILRALSDHYQDGATPAQLRGFMRDAYGRAVERSSMGPQLSRLKEEGLVEQTQHGEKFKWSLSVRGTLQAVYESTYGASEDDSSGQRG